MVRSIIFGGALLVSAVPAHAAPMLWRDIEAGATEASVKARYPAVKGAVKHKKKSVKLDNVQITSSCKADANINFRDGVVESVVLEDNGALVGSCSEMVLTSLSAKYGQPSAQSQAGESLFSYESKNYVWSHDGVVLLFKRFTNDDAGLSGAGLFTPSWELTYSALQSAPDL